MTDIGVASGRWLVARKECASVFDWRFFVAQGGGIVSTHLIIGQPHGSVVRFSNMPSPSRTSDVEPHSPVYPTPPKIPLHVRGIARIRRECCGPVPRQCCSGPKRLHAASGKSIR